MPPLNNIFISYGRADARELAIRIRDDLKAVGYKVWLDTDDIAGGDSWMENIEHAIEHCDMMLALLSPHAFQSQWCRSEQLRAIRKGKRIIPLLAVAGSEVPLHLEHLNYLDFSDQNRYEEMFRDLLSDITAGIAFVAPHIGRGGGMIGDSPYEGSKQLKNRSGDSMEKRTAPSFRRHFRQLREEGWLGARFWWPYFLFYYTDVHSLVDILHLGELPSRFSQGGNFKERWDKFVRLYFRPRTPDLYHSEGFRSDFQHPVERYTPMPVYLLFDLEAVILQPDSRFSDGNPAKTGKTYKTPAYFRDMPFEQIYHDSWFTSDEREEIMRYREAQVLIPDRLGLEALQLIWLRSPAEYETLHQLLPTETWRKWRDKLTARSDYHLFNNKWPYVQLAILQANSVRLRFNPCQGDCQPFAAKAFIEYADGDQVSWEDTTFIPERDLVIQLKRDDPYTLRFTLNDDLAYAGEFKTSMLVVG